MQSFLLSEIKGQSEDKKIQIRRERKSKQDAISTKE